MSESTEVLTVNRVFEFPAETVFDAWIDPKIAGKWLFATPTGKMIRVDIDPRVGGSFSIMERRGDDDVDHVGKYLELDKPRRLVFTFGVPKFSEQFTTLSIDIVPHHNGCELTLRHEGVLPEWRDRTQKGWNTLLGNLAVQLQSRSANR